MSVMPKQKPGTSNQNYGTPKLFLRAVLKRLEIDRFALDVCTDSDHQVRLHSLMTGYYTEAENGLLRPWSRNGWNWCNPPYGHINPWVRRAWRQSRRGCSTAVLVPASIGANWWRDWVHNKAMVLFLNGRITFVGQTDPYPKDCALLLYTPVEVPRYDIWSWNLK